MNRIKEQENMFLSLTRNKNLRDVSLKCRSKIHGKKRECVAMIGGCVVKPGRDVGSCSFFYATRLLLRLNINTVFSHDPLRNFSYTLFSL